MAVVMDVKPQLLSYLKELHLPTFRSDFPDDQPEELPGGVEVLAARKPDRQERCAAPVRAGNPAGAIDLFPRNPAVEFLQDGGIVSVGEPRSPKPEIGLVGN